MLRQLSAVHKTLVMAAAVLMCMGCGSDAGPVRTAVSGSVSFDGEPVEEGTISFVPNAGTQGPLSGGEIKAGRYEITADQGAVLGSHRVEILANRDTGKTIEAVPPATGKITVTEQYIPEKFNKQSKLTVEIKAGENTHDFELKP